MYGGGPAPKDPERPTSSEIRSGSAFYRRLCDRGEIKFAVVGPNRERYIDESDLRAYWQKASGERSTNVDLRAILTASRENLRAEIRRIV